MWIKFLLPTLKCAETTEKLYVCICFVHENMKKIEKFSKNAEIFSTAKNILVWHTSENSHTFLNVFYTWCKPLTVPYINACSLLTYD